MHRMSWTEICHRGDCRGRWVALDDCRYDANTGRATEGTVIDTDEDLVRLCGRIQRSRRRHCAILFCSGDCAPANKVSHKLAS